MPIYNFRNKETDEVIEIFLTISGRDDYLKENPDMIQVHLSSPKTVKGVGEIYSKGSKGFKDVIGRIADANPYSPLGLTYGTDKSAKAAKTREVVTAAKKKILK